MEYDKLKYPNAWPTYLENQQAKPFYHTNLKDSLEGITLTLGPAKQYGGLETIFSDRARTSKATVKAILDDIRKREYLDSNLLNKIDYEICSQHTALMGLENVKLRYSPDLAEYMNKRKSHLESNVLGLEEEKRKEYLECWRDLMFLKKYLLSALRDYWDIAKKRDLLSYPGSQPLENENIKGY